MGVGGFSMDLCWCSDMLEIRFQRPAAVAAVSELPLLARTRGSLQARLQDDTWHSDFGKQERDRQAREACGA